MENAKSGVALNLSEILRHNFFLYLRAYSAYYSVYQLLFHSWSFDEISDFFPQPNMKIVNFFCDCLIQYTIFFLWSFTEIWDFFFNNCFWNRFYHNCLSKFTIFFCDPLLKYVIFFAIIYRNSQFFPDVVSRNLRIFLNIISRNLWFLKEFRDFFKLACQNSGFFWDRLKKFVILFCNISQLISVLVRQN